MLSVRIVLFIVLDLLNSFKMAFSTCISGWRCRQGIDHHWCSLDRIAACLFVVLLLNKLSRKQFWIRLLLCFFEAVQQVIDKSASPQQRQLREGV